MAIRSWFRGSLYRRMTLMMASLFIVLGVIFFLITQQATQQYYEELTQRLNASIGMYVVQERPLIVSGQLQTDNIAFLAHQAMVINPSLEIYLLDDQGAILWPHGSDAGLLRQRIELQPIQTMIAGSDERPLYADDPKQRNGHKIFSAFPINDNGDLAGYVFAILGGQYQASLTESLRNNFTLKISLAAIVLVLLFGFVAAYLGFALLTRPLRRLQRAVADYRLHDFSEPFPRHALPIQDDEIGRLSQTVADMAERIQQQWQVIERNDHNRRQLIANVSHDLRTPLSSLQGFLETLMLKNGQLDKQEQRRYLEAAHRHALRLRKLVGELFELARLDAGAMTLQLEPFSLTELMYDLVQEFEVKATEKSITLSVHSPDQHAWVCADIALIQRVLENLIANAIRYTPVGGQIRLCAHADGEHMQISVEDTGSGIAAEELPYIFDRFFRGKQERDDDNEACTGLGLTIAKRIIDLHNSELAVSTEPQKGSAFRFALPAA